MNHGRGANRGGRSGGKNSGLRGPSQRSAEHYVVRGSVSGDRSGDASSTPGSGSTNTGRRHSDVASIDGVMSKFNDLLTSEHPQGPKSESIGVRNTSPNAGNSKQNVLQSPKTFYPALSSHSVLDTRMTAQMVPSHDEREETCKGEDSSIRAGQSSEGSRTKVECGSAHSQTKGLSFDICEEKNKNSVKLKPPLLVKNRAMRNERKRHEQGENIKIIRPGMILLKGYLSSMDQVKLIKSCRDLGNGPGGFYQPGYRDGATLNLKMMCLGKHWDPETGEYREERPIDETKPPPIPDEFLQMVKQAIKECHDYLESHTKEKNVRSIVPSMSPDICIINFYTKTGKLGLHQDKDESPESLQKGLPVVSFSLGDSAEFLFGDDRDINKADKVELESGDVLIFGGKSRHVFHGVSSIKPSTAPEDLLKETNLKPGRLNLTFRKY